MVRQRPRRAYRPPLVTRVARIAVPIALVGLGTTGVVAFATPDPTAQVAVPAPSLSTAVLEPTPSASATREQPVSRSEPRPSASEVADQKAIDAKAKKAAAAKAAAAKAAAALPELDVVGTMYATDDLNIRVDPSKDSDVVTVVDPGTKLSVTAAVRDGFRYVSYAGKGRWVNADYISKDKPDPESTGGVTSAPCGLGSSMESGLTSDAILVHRTLCARYPQITSFGGKRGGGGFHATGQAVDCMISDSTVGWQVANWVRAHAKELGVSEVIYSQKIWTVQRGSEGWRGMSDRGSKTANHYDHVHVSVYGSRATG